ncbi:MAG: CpsD/CapB family tyrosine-protein kinase, partial [Armatimonadota bacterium]|nr:CpsD/CapB family tyrosine-protein kinase [Armatimonadota bacterium]
EEVLLVDCDLRKPKLHRLCGVANRIGFTNVATGTKALEECYQETKLPGLRVLTSGPIPPNPFKMLNSKSGRALIQQLSREADFVVIDTPPSLMLADAHIVATMADAVILVISSQDARKREITRTRDLLIQTGSELLGTVLTKVKGGLGGYSDYYQHKSYSGYLDSVNHHDEGDEEPTAALVAMERAEPENGRQV